jgi:tryptophan synthase alpha chain
MSRYPAMFRALQARAEGAFIPFAMVGDPDLATSERILLALIEGGADALEVGLPFSDPIADGPVIQAAAVRALASGARIEGCFEVLASVRARHPDVPFGILTYANIVAARGLGSFYARAAAAGVDSVLVADVPTREGERFAGAAEQAGIDPVFIAPPNASPATLERVARLSRGYTYCVARKGVTGAGDALHLPPEGLFAALRALGAPPPVLGFGISAPAHVAGAIAAGAAGAISGSAVVSRIASLAAEPAALLEELARFTRELKGATRRAPG